ncbi:40S ribosomal protein S13 [Glycine soja]|uniref:40S ribosomal protein S13 n=1 Tax=Glycine soja TaxID=3848 RepID=A0A445ILW6_GLYSO|nr:40S ribosomal protein S13 [Glycine soja]
MFWWLFSRHVPEFPKDMYHLNKKEVSIRKHLERNKKDKDSKFRLILVDNRIHRLARYYKKTKKLSIVAYVKCSVAESIISNTEV